MEQRPLPLSESERERYARHIALDEIGEQGQLRLLAARVLVVGLGGLGSAVAPCLAGAGIGAVGLCDCDTVSLSNLQRQLLYTTEQVGLSKAECAAERLSRLSPGTRIEIFPDGLTAENALSIVGRFDIVVDCTDNFSTRYLIDDVCHRAAKPWVYGSIGEFGGRVAVFNGSAGVRFTDLYPEREALCALGPSSGGVVGAVPAVVGALQAAEVIKMVCGMPDTLDGRLFIIDIKTLQTTILEI